MSGQEIPKPHKKGPFLAVVAVIAAVLIVSWVLLYKPEIPVPTNNVSYSEYTEEQVDLIVESNYPHMRKQLLSRSEALTTCLASAENNVDRCSLLDNEDSIKECERNYNLILSYKNKCEDLETIEDSWVDLEAGFCEKVNSLSCDGLTGNTELLCRYLVEGDIDLCLDLPGGNQNGCNDHMNLYFSLKEGDISYCNQMTQSYDMILCVSLIDGSCSESIDKLAKDMIYLDLSEKADNIDFCDKIVYDFIKNLCIAGKGLQDVV